MQKVIIVLLACCAASAHAEKWQLLTANGNERLLIDLDSITSRNDIVEGRIRLIEQKTDVSTQDDMRFLMTCGDRRGAIVEWATYQSSKGAPAQLKKYQRAPNAVAEKFDPITPDTYGEAIGSFACTWQSMKERLFNRLPLTP